MKIEKKILPEYYQAVRERKKTFEIRTDDDNVQPGDILTLREWDGEKYTGHKITREVTYVLRNCPEYGLMDGYCVIGVQPIGWNDTYFSPAVVPSNQSQILRRTTNADRIRAMSNEELAKWCNDYNFNCPPVDCRDDDCPGCWLEWLQSPAEGGG